MGRASQSKQVGPAAVSGCGARELVTWGHREGSCQRRVSSVPPCLRD